MSSQSFVNRHAPDDAKVSMIRVQFEIYAKSKGYDVRRFKDYLSTYNDDYCKPDTCKLWEGYLAGYQDGEIPF